MRVCRHHVLRQYPSLIVARWQMCSAQGLMLRGDPSGDGSPRALHGQYRHYHHEQHYHYRVPIYCIEMIHAHIRYIP